VVIIYLLHEIETLFWRIKAKLYNNLKTSTICVLNVDLFVKLTGISSHGSMSPGTCLAVKYFLIQFFTLLTRSIVKGTPCAIFRNNTTRSSEWSFLRWATQILSWISL